MLTILSNVSRPVPGNPQVKRIYQEWHTGEQNPVNYDNVWCVLNIQADGDELNYILKRFPNLLVPCKVAADGGSGGPIRVIRFFDETARFIVGNLV